MIGKENKAKRSARAIAYAIAVLALAGATVPQDSPDKYYFSVPKSPGRIKGVVIGDPPAYHAMRSEDLDWLNEAACERMALMTGAADGPKYVLVPEFGKWPLSETNGYEKWTTAVYVDENDNALLVTNIIVRYSYKETETRINGLDTDVCIYTFILR